MSDLRVMYNLALSPFRKAPDSHKGRLESFYAGQAGDYDAFRKRLLSGREEMVQSAAAHHGSGGIWVDMGGGTGANLEMMGDEAIMSFAKVYLVDLCGPLLDVARKRCEERGWHNVQIIEEDATTWVPEEGFGQVDLLTFSYSLTMIPDWFAALDHAAALLAEGGHIGVVDFYVARKHPEDGMTTHSWLQRTFWPTWFAMDDVRMSSDHLPFLRRRFEQLELYEGQANVPYIGRVLPQVPYYRFIGQLRADAGEVDTEPAVALKLPAGASSVKGPKLSVAVAEFKPARLERAGSLKSPTMKAS